MAFPTFKERCLSVETQSNEILLGLEKAEDLFYESVIRIPQRTRLNPEVEAYIIEESEKLRRHTDFQISIQIAKERLLNSKEIISLIRKHILDWVALWRPAELLLFEWRIHKRNARLFDTISRCKVQFVQ